MLTKIATTIKVGKILENIDLVKFLMMMANVKTSLANAVIFLGNL